MARASAVAVTRDAEGRADAFRAFLAAYREEPDLTSSRLQLEALPKTLGGARVVFKLGDDVEVIHLPPYAEDDAR